MDETPPNQPARKPRRPSPSRGGKRPNAGRKPSAAGRSPRISFALPADLLAALNARVASSSPPRSRSALIVDALRAALSTPAPAPPLSTARCPAGEQHGPQFDQTATKQGDR